MKRRDSFTGTATGGAVTGNGASALIGVLDGFGTATVVLEMSFDGGTNFDVYGSYTADAAVNIPAFPSDVIARFRCTTYSSGTVVAGLAT